MRNKWPLKYRFWYHVHTVANKLAWKFVPLKSFDDPRKQHWLWRVNDWASDHWVLWYVERKWKVQVPLHTKIDTNK